MIEIKPNTKLNLQMSLIIASILIVGVIIGAFIPGIYDDWRKEIYDIGYNQSRIDTVFTIANEGSYPVYWQTENGSVLVFATLQQICGGGQDATTS